MVPCSCRFLRVGAAIPQSISLNFKDDPHTYIYNATCISAIRAAILAAYNQPRPGLVRPASASSGPASSQTDWGSDYWDAAAKSLKFLQAQWAGALPVNYNISWREAGFVGACSGAADGGSFATGGALPTRTSYLVMTS